MDGNDERGPGEPIADGPEEGHGIRNMVEDEECGAYDRVHPPRRHRVDRAVPYGEAPLPEERHHRFGDVQAVGVVARLLHRPHEMTRAASDVEDRAPRGTFRQMKASASWWALVSMREGGIPAPSASSRSSILKEKSSIPARRSTPA